MRIGSNLLPSNVWLLTPFLYRLIDSPREQIRDAVAVYFVLPTRENIAKICQDCKAQLYSNYYFNFITPISRSLLEDLAKAAVESNCVPQISKVSAADSCYKTKWDCEYKELYNGVTVPSPLLFVFILPCVLYVFISLTVLFTILFFTRDYHLTLLKNFTIKGFITWASNINFCFLQVFDQYLNFISLEEDLFVSRHNNTRELSYYGNLNIRMYMYTNTLWLSWFHIMC